MDLFSAIKNNSPVFGDKRIELIDLVNLLKKIPIFTVLISFVDVLFYYLADNETKRNLLFDMETELEPWRFLTYMLIHKDFVHLFLNVVVQALSGVVLEKEQGTFRCAVIYIFGGLAGALGTAIFSPPILMAGASAAVYALLTSHLANIILNYEVIDHVKYRTAAVFFVIFSDIVHVVCHICLFNNENPRIEWIAHASGAISGFLLGLIGLSGHTKCKKAIRIASSVVLLVIAAECCIYLTGQKLFGN